MSAVSWSERCVGLPDADGAPKVMKVVRSEGTEGKPAFPAGIAIEATPDGGMKLCCGDSEICLTPEGIVMKSGEARVALSASGTVDIRGAERVKVEGRELELEGERRVSANSRGGVQIRANKNLEMQGLNVRSDARLSHAIRGGNVRSEAQGLNEVDGALVKVN